MTYVGSGPRWLPSLPMRGGGHGRQTLHCRHLQVEGATKSEGPSGGDLLPWAPTVDESVTRRWTMRKSRFTEEQMIGVFHFVNQRVGITTEPPIWGT